MFLLWKQYQCFQGTERYCAILHFGMLFGTLSWILILSVFRHNALYRLDPRHTLLRNRRMDMFWLPQEKRPRTKALYVLGERHSGTRWVYQHLRECFHKNTSLVISDSFTRWKHWFQYKKLSDLDAFTDRYVIAMVRNPYHWVERMRRVPFHCPRHKNMEWKEFVTTPWTMPRYGRDLEIMNTTLSLSSDSSNSTQNRKCQQEFEFQDVVPCWDDDKAIDGMHPFYEHNPHTGTPYASIIDLRRDKILNFLSVRHYSGVQYMESWKMEDLITYGSEPLLNRLELLLGIQKSCTPDFLRDPSSKYPPLQLEYVEWMDQNLDWNLSEALLGYNPREYL
jgi:hypothetical protein